MATITDTLTWAREHDLSVVHRLVKMSRPVPETGCRVWTGATYARGYGHLSWGGREAAAHRVAWQLAHKQDIPPGMCVCHTCDNPPCINPDHLFLGTMRDNMLDKRRKGRGHGSLSPEQVRGIRADSKALSKGALVRKYNAHRRTVQRILDGTGYTHVPD